MLELNGLGILLSAIFIGGVGAFCFWAFRVAPISSQPAAPEHRPTSQVSRVLVPVMPATLAEAAVERASRWEPSRKKELVLVYVIVVPDILALDASLPEQDQAANAALDRAYAIAKKRGLPARMYVVRQRNVADGILQVAREEQADAIMLSVGPAAQGVQPWEQTSGQVLHRAPCEVIVDRVALATGA